MKAPMLIPAVAASGLALGVVNAQPCAAQTAPSLDARADWTADNWPQGGTIRFSAAPSLERYAYAVQISRASPAAGAIVRLVKLITVTRAKPPNSPISRRRDSLEPRITVIPRSTWLPR